MDYLQLLANEFDLSYNDDIQKPFVKCAQCGRLIESNYWWWENNYDNKEYCLTCKSNFKQKI